MRLFQAGHLAAQSFSRSEQRVGLGNGALAIVDGVGGRKRVPVAEDIVRPQSSEIFADGLSRIVVGQRCAARQAAHRQLRTIRGRPELHVLQHRRIQFGDGSVDARGIRQQSQPRFGVGNHADVALRQHLPEAFIVTEQEPLVLLERTSQRAAELVSAKRRNRALVEEVAGVEIAVAEKLEQRTVQLVGARLSNHADLSARAFSVLGAVGVGERIELADGVDAQQFSADAAGRDGKLAGFLCIRCR